MPNPLENKRIVLGVTGAVPAFKAVDLASGLTQNGALVDVILSEDAARFITPLTFQSVTDRKAYTDDNLWGEEGHLIYTGLGHAADLALLAPASANTIAKMAHGILRQPVDTDPAGSALPNGDCPGDGCGDV